ncbi:MAG: protein BatD [Methylococcales bacterium]|nr:MAG: protein BatD [Methylococcales bacterium]
MNIIKRLIHYKVFILMTLLLISQQILATTIQVETDRNPVNLNESFKITFTANETPDDDPDFRSLEQNFSILNQSSGSSSSWINGKSTKILQWSLTVMAKHAGNLMIPAVKFGHDASSALQISVTEAVNNKASTNDEDIFLEVEATSKNIYIQSQVLYTLRLYTRVDLSQARLDEPELADAVIERLGDDSRFNTQVNGLDYSVTERKYAIFPQKSGKLTIKPLTLTAEIISNNRPNFNGFFNSQATKTKRIESKAISLDVKPAPASFTGKHWLSAQQLVFKQEWSGDIKHLKIGEPLTRTLTLLAKGATVSQLPELNTAISNDQLKAYPDQPVLQEQKKTDGVIAFREEKIALILSQAGDYQLPAIQIPWFNTENQKMEMAEIPETTLTALAGAQPVVNTPQITSVNSQAINTTPTINTVPETNFWMWLSLCLATTWLITVIVFLKARTKSEQLIKDVDVNTDISDAIKALKKACTQNDATAAKNALIAWGNLTFNQSTLGGIADFCDARLRDELLHLNHSLYGQASSEWQGKKLFQAFTENKARQKKLLDRDNSLEPLNRL